MREMADHSDLASDVIAINKGIVRYCKKCGSSTLWKLAAAGSAPSEDAPGEPGALGLPAAPHPWRLPKRPGTPPQKTAPGPWAARMGTEKPEPAPALDPVTGQPSSTHGTRTQAAAA